MKEHVAVIPSDQVVIVDGHPLHFDFNFPENLHALQWRDGSGHLEFKDGLSNRILTLADYAVEVVPFVILWEAEKTRRVTAEAAAEAARLAAYNASDARAARVRAERDRRIAATDYLLAIDYPLPDADKLAVTAYRQALRDLPAQDGFPWTGGGEDDKACPWPRLPGFLA